MIISRSIFSKVIIAFFIISASLLYLAPKVMAADAANCTDHPLFTRMQNMNIVSCKTVDLDKFYFKTGNKTAESIE